MREEEREEELETHEVDTVTLPPEQQPADREEKEQKSAAEEERKTEPDKISPPADDRLEIDEPDNRDLDIERATSELLPDIDFSSDLETGDFNLNFPVAGAGSKDKESGADTAAGSSSGADVGTFSAGELDQRPSPLANLEPRYPYTARMKEQEGYVEVRFVVTEEGNVVDPEVRDAEPPEVFNDAALQAVKQWRFEPGTKDGEKVRSRVQLRIRFNLEDY